MEDEQILALYISPGHNFFGHHGRQPDCHGVLVQDEIHCLAGRGIEGDRFLDYQPDYKGQITFFAEEVFDELCRALDLKAVSPSALRRNVITRGLDLNALIGKEFDFQGVRFVGTGECKPCYWMNSAVHPEAEAALQGKGGLRAKILTDGILRTSQRPLAMA